MKKRKIKQSIAGVMALLMIINAVPYTDGWLNSITSYASTARVNATTLNVRSGPGTTYSVAGKLTNGNTVTVVGQTTGTDGRTWSQIQYTGSGGKEAVGYVLAAYLKSPTSYSHDSSFESYLNSQGFPDSYKDGLRLLHAEYPNWVFIAQHTNLDWNTVIENESIVGRNLVHTSSVSSWKSTAEGAYNWNTSTWPGFDSSSYVAASSDIIRYYMDPRNFLDDKYVFQFLLHSYNSSAQTAEGLKSMVQGTFLSGSTQASGITSGNTSSSSGSSAGPGAGTSSSNTSSGGPGVSGSGSGSSGTSLSGPGVSGNTTSGSSSGTSGSKPGSTSGSTSGSSSGVTTGVGPGGSTSGNSGSTSGSTSPGNTSSSGSSTSSGNSSSPGNSTSGSTSGSKPSVSFEAPGKTSSNSNSNVKLEGPSASISKRETNRVTALVPGLSGGPGASSAALETTSAASSDNSSPTEDNLSTTTGTGTTTSYVDILISAASKSGVNPYVLAAMILQEQGTNGTGKCISGTVSGYQGYYNFFNIEAYQSGSMNAVSRGLWYASQSGSYERPWNSRDRSIIGGAEYYGTNYVKVGQDTFYLKKFNVQGSNLYKHQYMTNIQGAASEGARLAEAYGSSLKQSALEFKIPVYNNMPASACIRPTGDGSPNNKLSGLSVDGFTLTPTFGSDVTSYDLIVSPSVSEVTVNATSISSAATISGAGTIQLQSGNNEITISVKAQNGSIRDYQIRVVRQNNGQTSTSQNSQTGPGVSGSASSGSTSSSAGPGVSSGSQSGNSGSQIGPGGSNVTIVQ